MIEIGRQPILWSDMQIYHIRIHVDYHLRRIQQHMIKEFFEEYFLHMSDITFDMRTNTVEVHDNFSDLAFDGRVHGNQHHDGGRVKSFGTYIENETSS
jgi:glucose-1-phosphate cytidylyltransferase